MSTTSMTLAEIRQAGLEVLCRELGPVGMIRFLQQFEGGQGDYTSARHSWLGGLTLEKIAKDIRDKKGKPAHRGG